MQTFQNHEGGRSNYERGWGIVGNYTVSEGSFSN